MPGVLRFSLCQHTDGRFLEDYQNYGKCRGFTLAARCGLPVSAEGFVLSDPSVSLTDLEQCDGESRLLCRPDAPLGLGNHLPRGRDLLVDEIPGFLSGLRQICDQAIILVLSHPSIVVLQRYEPRYRTSGGAMISVSRGAGITVEYVGPGFDVGDITRGREVHCSFALPWDQRHDDPASILQFARMSGAMHRIDQDAYSESRAARLTELAQELGESSGRAVAEAIPSTPSPLTHSCLVSLCELYRQTLNDRCTRFLPSDFSIMANLYGNQPYVFEIFVPDRSVPQER